MTLRPVAALFVDPKGAYVGLEGVDAWPEARDARRYAGPDPVVAHPPCARWCRMAGLVEHRYGYRVGDDGGCFASALASVRQWGGVLEHPAWTLAWPTHGLPPPANRKRGGWTPTDCGGWVCHVEQGRYGHPARKATWLYVRSLARPFELRWGPTINPTHTVSWLDNNGGEKRPRLRKKAASATPVAFRDTLLALARSVEIGGTQ